MAMQYAAEWDCDIDGHSMIGGSCSACGLSSGDVVSQLEEEITLMAEELFEAQSLARAAHDAFRHLNKNRHGIAWEILRAAFTRSQFEESDVNFTDVL
jgi:hypothetical protein